MLGRTYITVYKMVDSFINLKVCTEKIYGFIYSMDAFKKRCSKIIHFLLEKCTVCETHAWKLMRTALLTICSSREVKQNLRLIKWNQAKTKQTDKYNLFGIKTWPWPTVILVAALSYCYPVHNLDFFLTYSLFIIPILSSSE